MPLRFIMAFLPVLTVSSLQIISIPAFSYGKNAAGSSQVSGSVGGSYGSSRAQEFCFSDEDAPLYDVQGMQCYSEASKGHCCLGRPPLKPNAGNSSAPSFAENPPPSDPGAMAPGNSSGGSSGSAAESGSLPGGCEYSSRREASVVVGMGDVEIFYCDDQPNGTPAQATCHTNANRNAPASQRYIVCPNPGAAPGNSASGKSKNQQEICNKARALTAECNAETSKAVESCDSEKGDMGQAIQGMKGATQGLQAVSNANVQIMCSKAIYAIGGLSAALGAFQIYCNNSRDKCMTSCKEAKKTTDACLNGETTGSNVAPPDPEPSLSACNNLKSRVGEAQQMVTNLSNTVGTAQSCQEYTAAMNQGSLCQRDPTAPGCANLIQSCRNAIYAASNVTCKCIQNPSDPVCNPALNGNSLNAGANFNNRPGGGAPTLRTPTADGFNSMGGGGGENFGGGGVFPAGSLAGGAGVNGGGEDPSGKKNSGSPLPGGGGGPGSGGASRGAPGAGGGGGDESGNSVISGWKSGGGYAVPGGPSGSGSSGSGGGNSGYFRGAQQPNLNQFRPQMQYDPKFNRGMAGVTGSDGLTGPHDNIWTKVKNRYQAKSVSLRP